MRNGFLETFLKYEEEFLRPYVYKGGKLTGDRVKRGNGEKLSLVFFLSQVLYYLYLPSVRRKAREGKTDRNRDFLSDVQCFHYQEAFQ